MDFSTYQQVHLSQCHIKGKIWTIEEAIQIL